MSDENSRIEGGVGIALGGGSVIGVPPIVHHGTEEQKKMWLPGLFTWETSFCLGITEPSGGVRKNTIWSYPQSYGELKDNNANWNV
jgi:alkylation response protein AidB-like acyl-CoA dehydrogenase